MLWAWIGSCSPQATVPGGTTALTLTGRGGDGAADRAGQGQRGGAQQEVVLAVGRAVGGQVVERPQLALGHAHVDQVQQVDRQQHGRVLGGHTSNTSVSVATAATSWSWSHSTERVDRPGEGLPNRALSPARRKCMCPVRTSRASPGSTGTPRPAVAASRSSPVMA